MAGVTPVRHNHDMRFQLASYSLVFLITAGCTSSGPTPAPVCGAPSASSANTQALAAADTEFAADFYGPAVAAAGASGNVIISSYSAAATLMMVGAGAAGDTATQIQSVLHLPLPAAGVAPRYAALACEDETQGNGYGNQLLIANAVWAQQGKSFEKSYLSTLSSGFDATLQQADFADDPTDATSAINSWVSKETQAEIPSLLGPNDITPDTRMVLVDAMYFKGIGTRASTPARRWTCPSRSRAASRSTSLR